MRGPKALLWRSLIAVVIHPTRSLAAMRSGLLLVLVFAAVWPTQSSIYDWPNVLGNSWLFDQGSMHGYRPTTTPSGGSYALQGPIGDWALGHPWTPLLQFDGAVIDAKTDAEYFGETPLDSRDLQVQKGEAQASCTVTTPHVNVQGPRLSPGATVQKACNVSLAGCCALCDGEAGCSAFVWDPLSDWSPCLGLPYCWTLSAFTGISRDPRTVFGSKNPVPPAPPSPPAPIPPRPPDVENATVLRAVQYPGSIALRGVGHGGLQVSAHLVFASPDTALIRLSLRNGGAKPIMMASFKFFGAAVNVVASSEFSLNFALPAPPDETPCFPQKWFAGGSLQLANFTSIGGQQQALVWSIETHLSGGSFLASSFPIAIPSQQEATTFVAVIHTQGLSTALARSRLGGAAAAERAFAGAISRWDGYLSTVVVGDSAASTSGIRNVDKHWSAVKALQTLLHNWRFVPGLPDGVLPSYEGYQGGFWSWDSYKQAVGMVAFAPDLAKQQLRLLAAAQDPITGHIPDKVDRCGRGGGCSGKPPLLSWAVWEVFEQTRDIEFARNMYPIMEAFHDFWYRHRDVRGVGLCSWTEGMESGMDDGVRFMPQYATSITNASSHVTTLNFWSIDLNAHLYKEKRILGRLALTLGDASASNRWNVDAARLLPILQSTFFQQGRGDQDGFFQDRYLNGSAVPVKGCEGFAALFAEVATVPQALAMAKVLGNPRAFLLNFSLPTVSKEDMHYDAHGYWKGPTWLDQTWFAYTGLATYAELWRRSPDFDGSEPFTALAEELKRRVFTVGVGFRANDTTPLHEHYHAETGEPQGVTHFSWTAAHALMWAVERGEDELLPVV